MGRLSNTIWAIAILAIIAFIGVPMGGFVFGITHSEGSGNPIPVGIIYALLTSLFLGFPPKNEGNPADTYNVWPYILGSDLALLTTLVIVSTGLWVISTRRRKTY
jgi:hypothetical protein